MATLKFYSFDSQLLLKEKKLPKPVEFVRKGTAQAVKAKEIADKGITL